MIMCKCRVQVKYVIEQFGPVTFLPVTLYILLSYQYCNRKRCDSLLCIAPYNEITLYLNSHLSRFTSQNLLLPLIGIIIWAISPVNILLVKRYTLLSYRYFNLKPCDFLPCIAPYNSLTLQFDSSLSSFTSQNLVFAAFWHNNLSNWLRQYLACQTLYFAKLSILLPQTMRFPSLYCSLQWNFITL